MSTTIKNYLNLIITSLGLAVIFNYLFFDKIPGISVAIFTFIFLGIIFFIISGRKIYLNIVWWIPLLIAFLAIMLSIRASEFLIFFNVIAILVLLMLLSNELMGKSAIFMKIKDYFILAVFVPIRMLAEGFTTLIQIGKINSRVKNKDVWVSVVKGIIMAVPILFIFGFLFSNADLAFSQFLNSFVNMTISDRLVGQAVYIVVTFVASLSYLSYAFSVKQFELHSEVEEISVDNGRSIEIMVFLGLISALFLLFIGFQITYLFGGEANILDAGFTYADYARRGFFELLAVAILSLMLLVVSDKYVKNTAKRKFQFMIPSLFLIAEVTVVIISAFKRLNLYIDAYGMTVPRFYVAGFIVLLSVWIIMLAIKFIALKKEQFLTFGVLLSLAVFLIVVNLINPDVFIIKHNMVRFEKTGVIDVSYFRELSADAVPYEIELSKKLEGENKIALVEVLQNQKERIMSLRTGWQSTNYSRYKAWKLLQELE